MKESVPEVSKDVAGFQRFCLDRAHEVRVVHRLTQEAIALAPTVEEQNKLLGVGNHLLAAALDLTNLAGVKPGEDLLGEG